MSHQGETVRLGISACLLGRRVRYDGGHKLDTALFEMIGPGIDWVPICPEADSGLPVPREEMRLVASPSGPRLIEIKTGLDHTGRLRQWAQTRVRLLAADGIRGVILKSRSPSCAVHDAPVVDDRSRTVSAGPGIFTRELKSALPLLPVEDGDRLHDQAILEDFMRSVIGYR